jgi:hypothetical protein
MTPCIRRAPALVSAAATLVATALLGGAPRAARACGGGLVTVDRSGVGADAQRIFISVRPTTTEVVTQIGVPSTDADYGVLLPVPAQPTLDPQPVPVAELESLDRSTAPQILTNTGGDDGVGCCLPMTGAGGASKGGPGAAVDVSQPVNIGPVTAVTLTADTGASINAWLAESGFVIPPEQQPLVDSYAGPGRYFIAIRRNQTAAAPGAPTSIGLHFTLPGDQRALPLRFARLGAAPTVAFTVFVFAPTLVAPATPFETVTIEDLDAGVLRASGYRAAVERAIAARNNLAFVIERGHPQGRQGLGPRLESLSEPLAVSQFTRLTTILPASALTTDVALDQVFRGSVGGTVIVENERPSELRRAGTGLGGLFGAALLGLRRRRRRR